MKTEFQKRLTETVERIGNASALARKAGISDQIVRKYLSENTQPGMENLVAMCRAAEVPMWWLATGEDVDPYAIPKELRPKPADVDAAVLNEAIEEALRLSGMDSDALRQAGEAGLIGLIVSIYRVKSAARTADRANDADDTPAMKVEGA